MIGSCTTRIQAVACREELEIKKNAFLFGALLACEFSKTSRNRLGTEENNND